MYRRLIIAAILAVSLGAPIAELFDSWDDSQQPGNDTEANVVVVALCIGATFAIGTIIVVARLRAFASASAIWNVVSRAARHPLITLRPPVPSVSPPAILRV